MSEQLVQGIRRAVELGGQAFRTRMREALASFDVAEVWDAILAHIRLEMQEEHSAGPIQDLRHHAEFIGRAFLTLLDRGVIQPVAPLTELGAKAIEDLRHRTGIHAEGQGRPEPEVKPLSAQEQLEAEVIADYNTLPSDKMRQKRNASKAYNETFVRLANENRLESRVTSAVLAGA